MRANKDANTHRPPVSTRRATSNSERSEMWDPRKQHQTRACEVEVLEHANLSLLSFWLRARRSCRFFH
jgi:hypothetical protein